MKDEHKSYRAKWTDERFLRINSRIDSRGQFYDIEILDIYCASCRCALLSRRISNISLFIFSLARSQTAELSAASCLLLCLY
jgi:hypothetical protein